MRPIRLDRLRFVLWAVAFVAVAAGPFFLGRIGVFLVMEAMMFGVAAVSLNLLIGFGKMVSFGHAAWWGLGAYTVGVTLQRLTGLGVLGAMGVAVLLTAVVSGVVGYFCVKRGTIYFAMLTLAFSQLVVIIILRMRGLTGGEQGLTGGVPRPPIGFFEISTLLNFYYFTLVVCSLALFAMAWFIASPFGLSLRALASNPERAEASGINVKLHQWATFVVSSVFASIGGGLHAIFQSAAFPETLHWTTSATFVFMSLIGGIESFAGPLIGAFIYIYLERFAGGALGNRELVLGVLLLFIVLVMRGGFVGAASAAARGVARRLGLVGEAERGDRDLGGGSAREVPVDEVGTEPRGRP
jgi:branched-chain amino acid transport system permease protein